MLVAVGDLIAAAQFLVVLILHAERLADVVDDVLVRRRVVAARCLVAGEVGVLDVGVDIAAGDGRRHGGVVGPMLGDFVATGPDCGAAPVHVER